MINELSVERLDRSLDILGAARSPFAHVSLKVLRQMRNILAKRPAKAKQELVILESPYAGNVEENVQYARAAIKDSLLRGEAPIASHLLYTQPGILNDENPDERRWGIDAGLAWGAVADKTVVYVDRGISSGMRYGIDRAKREGRPVEFRKLDGTLLEHELEMVS